MADGERTDKEIIKEVMPTAPGLRETKSATSASLKTSGLADESAPSAPEAQGPRCPKCSNTYLPVVITDITGTVEINTWRVRCSCGHVLASGKLPLRVADFRQFFPSSAQPPQDRWRSLIGPQAEEKCWENMCKSFHDEIATALGLSLYPVAGFVLMLAEIRRLKALAQPPADKEKAR